MKPKAPSIDSVTTINEDGSRYFVHPADVSGPFTLSRRIFAIFLIALYVSLPFIPIKGEPAVFLDIFHRKLHIFGLTLMFQDLWLLFFLITGMAFGLFVVTSVAGRLWCGWACPQTVFLDHVFRRVERFIDGDAPARRRLEDAPWTGGKIFKRALKHGIFFLLSAAIAHMFLSYFVSLPSLYAMMRHSPGENWGFFLFVFALTGVLYFNFAWFREQFCIIMCPYGRLGSALIDDNSIVVGYDTVRGEPRGKAGTTTGDCIDCRRCVQVCPTGIDIRQGLQMECISCEACIDACDEIMVKIGRPKGLVRHDSLNALAGRPSKFWRPRLLIYIVLGMVGASAFAYATQQVKPVILSVLRMQGAPYFRDQGSIRNNFMVRVANKRAETHDYTVTLDSPAAGLSSTGASAHKLALGPGEEVQEPLIMTLPDADFHGNFDVKVQVRGQSGQVEGEKTVPFLGPFREAP
ncbi:MAG: cytochrome c oxidase accessory protein CcoG [Chthoniobacterales bacterium]|nr:cytochrome c oxidase accessory protein CcoG [Chthoniobacterales bacterium]